MRHSVFIYFFIIFVFASLIGGSVFTTYTEFVSEGPLEKRTEVLIPKGKGLKEIARILKDEGVIKSPSIFILGVRASRQTSQIKAGEYSFPPYASPKMVMGILVSGETYIRKLVVPEGLTSAQIIELMNKAKGLVGEVDETPKNGTLLPETYHYSYGDTKKGMIQRMERAMERELAHLWEKRDPDTPLRSPQEAVILASVVEKETALKKERPLIASAFVNRLKKGMKLQSDPTVIYAITDGTYQMKRALTYKDLRYKDPYNTYVVEGLPRGPISNPGKSAIAAVLNPAKTKFIYFVADGTGGHAFAETYQEHQKNVKNWRRIRKSGSSK